VDLPTYTNIWRIEKRLYKLYDFRLPMPLPVGQIAVFGAFTVPYVLTLTLLGMPFSHTLFWLYVLPPGALTWLATRPVLEGKRLPELLLSQIRYLCEPRAWCRLAPLAEPDDIAVWARVWRPVGQARPGWPDSREKRAGREEPAVPVQRAEPPGRAPAQRAEPVATRPRPAAAPATRVTVTGAPVARRPLAVEQALSRSQARHPGRAARSGLAGRAWRDSVAVVPGGHRPGRPDLLQQERARARLPMRGPGRIVVLGCTMGAGQTITALTLGTTLASLRAEPVALLDLNSGTGPYPGPGRASGAGSLARRAAALPAGSGVEVITGDGADGDVRADVGRRFSALSARYRLAVADPCASVLPWLLPAASLLVLVTPATPEAASALITTREWLEAHGHSDLANASVTVLNGVSARTSAYVAQAEAVARGRCRAIVRVPWDDTLKDLGSKRGSGAARPHRLSDPAVRAVTALAGVVIASLTAEADGGAPPASARVLAGSGAPGAQGGRGSRPG